MSPQPAGSKPPGELEQQVLMVLAACGDEASGGTVYDELVAKTRRELSLAAIYITLDRLRRKGWVATRTQAPEPGRGGKPRKFYSLRHEGAQQIRELREQFDRLWGGAADHPLLASAKPGRR